MEDKVAPVLNFQEVDPGRKSIHIDSKFVAGKGLIINRSSTHIQQLDTF